MPYRSKKFSANPVPSEVQADLWDHRADLAESAVRNRHGHRLWAIPGTNLAATAWPAAAAHRWSLTWHYWWQAHYLDCQLDAVSRRPTKERLKTVRATRNSMILRNFGRVTSNHYYDDKAWLALALQRYKMLVPTHRPVALRSLIVNLTEAIDSATGVLPWKVGMTFYNVPTNGPASILFARLGRIDEAAQLTDWIFDNLLGNNGLIKDGIRLEMIGPVTEERAYTYNQGVMIGACLEIAKRLAATQPEKAAEYQSRAANLVHSVAKHLADDKGVVRGGGGGDGGLFNGVLVRYLALAALEASDPATRKIARRLVLQSAEAAWRHRLDLDGLPLFSADWAADARVPQSGGVLAASVGGAVNSSELPERDLSVQLSGWMLMEAAAKLMATPDGTGTSPAEK